MVLLESYRDKAKCEHLRKGKVILLYRISKKKKIVFPILIHAAINII